MPNVELIQPIATGTRSRGNPSRTRPNASGNVAAPTPCTARADEHTERAGERGEQRAGRRHRQAHEQHPAPAEHVTEPAELADRLDLNRSHLVGYLDDVERRDLVRRERDPDDRRRQRVALTPAGKSLQRKLAGVAERTQARFLHVLSEEERDTLVTLLRKVLSAEDGTHPAGGK
ncbi:MAG: winged helix DNA-binding protein [Actinophytocola sp.]|uniref:MarR family winged helix-turn-helix transcriptional regulator n=1 Tax=Actinophytocola sp. TaxID=1872138 RepID=UPI00132153CD|nr:MarR family winged helix-turn-helix transcriptional regulator [Actinophytocola sp.]MPZ85835.1 winged helix DNA-binding protein [Actinophytocola sp.]